jgi:hypothetical protein
MPLDPARPGQSAGWVTALVQHLENFLGQEIGPAEGFTVWKDKYNLRGNTPLLKRSRPSSNARRSSLRSCLQATSLRDGARTRPVFSTLHFAGDLAGRVFIVEKAKLDDAAVVQRQLTGLRNYRFWYIDDNKQPRTFATPVPRLEEIQYFRQVQDLARDVQRNLKAMARVPRVPERALPPLTDNGANGPSAASSAHPFIGRMREVIGEG